MRIGYQVVSTHLAVIHQLAVFEDNFRRQIKTINVNVNQVANFNITANRPADRRKLIFRLSFIDHVVVVCGHRIDGYGRISMKINRQIFCYFDSMNVANRIMAGDMRGDVWVSQQIPGIHINVITQRITVRQLNNRGFVSMVIDRDGNFIAFVQVIARTHITPYGAGDSGNLLA